MTSKSSTLLALILSFCITIGAKASEAEDQFKKAATFYGRNNGGRPWPANEQSGLELLTASADANYPPALFNMFLGYNLGFLGAADGAKAKEYRLKWLIAENTPSSYLELGRGFLGIGTEVPDPEQTKLPSGCIFTGEIIRNQRQPPKDSKWLGRQRNDDRDDERAVYCLQKAVELGLSKEMSAADRKDAEKAADLLIGAVVGTPIPLNNGQNLIIARGYALKATTLRAILRAIPAKLANREKAAAASLRLFEDLSDEELSKAFSEWTTSKPN